MQPRNRELWYALLTLFLITLLYSGVVASLGTIPAARGFFGHSLGVVGFVLMLLTETLYSLRKRSRKARWGRMSSWLQVHIYTGLVGPFLVLLHSAWEFNGLAGMVMLFTAVIVVSGFIGRYIYTAVPRTADGAEMQAHEVGEQIRAVENELNAWIASQPPTEQARAQRLASLPQSYSSGPSVVLTRAFADLSSRLAYWNARKTMDPNVRRQSAQLARLVEQRRALHRQLASLAAARRLLAVWHAVHIPIGMVLFTASLVHIAGAIYFATLLH